MGEKKKLLFIEIKKIIRKRYGVRVRVGKIWSWILDKLILGVYYIYECSYRVGSRIFKSGVKGVLRYIFESYLYINGMKSY